MTERARWWKLLVDSVTPEFTAASRVIARSSGFGSIMQWFMACWRGMMLTWSSVARHLAAVALPVTLLVACGGAGGSGELSAGSESQALSTPINIGFGGEAKQEGDVWQFGGITDFFKDSVVAAKPALCHLYLPWDVALPTGNTEVLKDQGDLHAWLNDERAFYYPFENAPQPNPCEDVLVSFKGTKSENGAEPIGVDDDPKCPRCFGTAFRKFLDAHWNAWHAKNPANVFSFTAWNEPNNGGNAGDDKGKPLSPETAALYYLMAKKICNETYHCKVAAGDMASNTPWVSEFASNCDDDDVGPKSCGKASWLDNYKVAIATHANEPMFKLGPSFRPDIWAYHGWQEINDYTYYRKDHPDPCNGNDTDCATDLMVRALKGARWTVGSGTAAELWDTEVGVGQQGKGRGDVDDKTQAEGAAYLLKVSAAAGVTRIYYQGVETDAWRITCGGSRRPSWEVLAKRQTSFTGPATTGVCTTDQAAVNADIAKAAPCQPGTHLAGSDDAGTALVTDEGSLTCVPNAGSGGLVSSGSDAGTAGGGLIK